MNKNVSMYHIGDRQYGLLYKKFKISVNNPPKTLYIIQSSDEEPKSFLHFCLFK